MTNPPIRDYRPNDPLQQQRMFRLMIATIEQDPRQGRSVLEETMLDPRSFDVAGVGLLFATTTMFAAYLKRVELDADFADWAREQLIDLAAKEAQDNG